MSLAAPFDDGPGPWRPAHAGLLALTIYLLTATRHVVGADNGEFVVLAFEGGRAHPPGYPLYTAYLQAMSWLPGHSPAHTTALATALLGGLGVWLLARAMRAWGASPQAAFVASLAYALSPQVWLLNTHAEAFALNCTVAAAIVWFSAPATSPAPSPLSGSPFSGSLLSGNARAFALGLLAGLGIANHHSIVLLAPIGLYGVWTALRESRSAIFAGVGALGGLVLGLSPYLLLFRAEACGDCLVWGRFEGSGDLLHHFLRRDYGTLALADGGAPYEPLRQLGVFVREMSVDFALGGVVLAALGIRPLFARSAAREAASVDARPLRTGRLMLLASLLLCGPVFVMLFNITPDDIGLHIIRRFYLLPALVLSVFLALGFDEARRHLPPRRLLALTAAFGLLLVAGGYARHAAYDRPTIEDFARNTLESLPEGAVLLGEGDALMLGIEYAQRLSGVRPDVTFVHARLVRFPWYLERVERALGVDVTLERRPDGLLEADTHTLASALLTGHGPGSGRRVFWAHPPRRVLDALPYLPHGIAVELLATADAPAERDVGDVLARNRALHAAYRFEARAPSRAANTWAWDLYSSYPAGWFRLAEWCRARGATACADEARAHAERFNEPRS